jgi:hypothetical protein
LLDGELKRDRGFHLTAIVAGDVASYISTNELGRRRRERILSPLIFSIPTFVPVDVAEGFVLMCNYTGKEVV